MEELVQGSAVKYSACIAQCKLLQDVAELDYDILLQEIDDAREQVGTEAGGPSGAGAAVRTAEAGGQQDPSATDCEGQNQDDGGPSSGG